ncbi:MAG: thioredoxin family protein [Kofleriaceae bacterium]
MRPPFVLALLFGCASTPAPKGRGLADDLGLANRAHHPLIAEFGATWCAPCHVFANTVLPDARVQAALRDVAFVQYDVDTAAGAEAARRCNVAGVPAIVLVAPDGTVRRMTAGEEPTTDQFLAFVAEAKASHGATY